MSPEPPEDEEGEEDDEDADGDADARDIDAMDAAAGDMAAAAALRCCPDWRRLDFFPLFCLASIRCMNICASGSEMLRTSDALVLAF